MAQRIAMRINLTALALALGGGLALPAGAQQTERVPPAYGAPQRQPPDRGDEIQLYSRPDGSSGEIPASPPPLLPPKSPPRATPYPNIAPTPPPDYGNDSEPEESPPGGSVQVQNDRGIRYVSGGVGEGERAELNALSSEFNLRLLFAMQGSGDYLADVRVNVLDSRGRVILSAQAQGPWFFAQLPPGVYAVEVGAIDQIQRQTARIDGSRQARLNFYWR